MPDPISVPGGAGSGPAPAPSPTPAAPTPAVAPPASTPGTPAPESTPGTPQTPAQDDLQDGNWRELRSRYDQQKAEIAALKANSNPAAAAAVTRAQSMARDLGYQDADFTEAFTKDPVRTMQILAEEAQAKAASGQQQPQDGSPDLNKQIEEAINAKLSPFQEQQNRANTDAAMVKYEQNFTQLAAADPILKEAPPEVIELVKDYLGEYFSTQPGILVAMKTKGDFTAMNDAMKFVSGRLHSAFKSWLNKTGNTAASSPTAPNGKGKITLDQIINDPGVLGKQYRE